MHNAHGRVLRVPTLTGITLAVLRGAVEGIHAKRSGELLELIEPFGFGKETLPPDDVTTKQPH